MDQGYSSAGNGNMDSSSSSDADHSVDQDISGADDPPSLADNASHSSAYSAQTTASDHSVFPPQRSSLARNGAPGSASTGRPSTGSSSTGGSPAHFVFPSTSSTGYVQPSSSAHSLHQGSSSTAFVQPTSPAHFVFPSSSSTSYAQPSSPAHNLHRCSSSTGNIQPASPALSILSDSSSTGQPSSPAPQRPSTSLGSPYAVAGSSRSTFFPLSRPNSADHPERKRHSSAKEGSKSLDQEVPGSELEAEGSQRKMSHETLLKRSSENVNQLQTEAAESDGMIDILQRESTGIRFLHKRYLKFKESAEAGVENSGISDELMIQVYEEIMDDLFLTFTQLDSIRFSELTNGVLEWLRGHLSIVRLGYLVQIVSQDSNEEPENEEL